MSSIDLEITSQFHEVLSTDDVDALKTALQNLMVLFEAQNRNYLELKQQVKYLKTKRPVMTYETADFVTILPEESKPITDGLIEESYELLAAIRRCRKIHNKTATGIEKTLSSMVSNEEQRTAQMTAAIINGD